MGGTYEAKNVVYLTPEEHFVAHQLLVKMYPKHRGLIKAAMVMAAGNERQNRSENKHYGWLRKRHSEALKGTTPWNKGKKTGIVTSSTFKEGHTPWNKGKTGLFTQTKDSNKRRSEALKGRKRPDFIGNTYAKGHTCEWTEEQRSAQSKRLKGRPKPTATCPHCNKVGGISAMKRWHFDNCKDR